MWVCVLGVKKKRQTNCIFPLRNTKAYIVKICTVKGEREGKKSREEKKKKEKNQKKILDGI